ncbi:cupin domain-containing protein [Methanosphaera cuniculi]|uniref:Cupin n=1 Tax=Methanosphaera cuniculi TaxID=1077256 RepID=A0A2A2HF20_9EURY|nr:cupin domain-containing protein [Methanosphaera cuniculi]PAV07955.1 cupin [Methanosphaera cuniculi]PWL08839.1 cupin domain protein [Methanosphaera cuniculi]
MSDMKKEVFKTAKLIDYQEDSVVSREIIKKETGTVTIFTFAKGQGLSKHSAPFDAMVQIIEGIAEITIDEEVFVLTEGEMIIMPANIPHALKAKEQYKMLLTMIKSE